MRQGIVACGVACTGERDGNLLIDEAIQSRMVKAYGGGDGPMNFPTFLGSRLNGFSPQLLSSSPEIWCEGGKAFLVAVRGQIARVWVWAWHCGANLHSDAERVLFPPPALGECRHRCLARRLVTVDRRAIFVVAIGQRPEPWCAHGRGGSFHDAADHNAVSEHVVIVIAPLAGSPAGGCPLEDERRHCHAIVQLHVSIRCPASVIRTHVVSLR